MKHKRTIIIPAVPQRTEEVTDYSICDRCKQKIMTHGPEVLNITIARDVGVQFPDGSGYGVKTSVDLCGLCFEEWFIPLLRSYGVEPSLEKYERE